MTRTPSPRTMGSVRCRFRCGPGTWTRSPRSPRSWRPSPGARTTSPCWRLEDPTASACPSRAPRPRPWRRRDTACPAASTSSSSSSTPTLAPTLRHTQEVTSTTTSTSSPEHHPWLLRGNPAAPAPQKVVTCFLSPLFLLFKLHIRGYRDQETCDQCSRPQANCEEAVKQLF